MSEVWDGEESIRRNMRTDDSIAECGHTVLSVMPNEAGDYDVIEIPKQPDPDRAALLA